jgi:hypothetical protein
MMEGLFDGSLSQAGRPGLFGFIRDRQELDRAGQTVDQSGVMIFNSQGEGQIVGPAQERLDQTSVSEESGRRKGGDQHQGSHQAGQVTWHSPIEPAGNDGGRQEEGKEHPNTAKGNHEPQSSPQACQSELQSIHGAVQ